MRLQVLPVPDLPLIRSGDDLAGLIIGGALRAGIPLESADVVVITAKVVSKAEGRWVNLNDVHPSERAERLAAVTEKDARLVELVLSESSIVVRARPGNLLVRHRRGYVSAVAGIDRSNVAADEDVALLLPADPDASAAALRDSLQALSGVALGVVISDSHGRPFRIGNTGVAIGAAGLTAVRHLEGTSDLFGRALTSASIVPVADLVASASMLVSGEADEGIPVVIVRGMPIDDDGSSGFDLIRPPERDLFATPDRDYS